MKTDNFWKWRANRILIYGKIKICSLFGVDERNYARSLESNNSTVKTKPWKILIIL